MPKYPLLVAASALMLLAACGSDDSGTSDAPATSSDAASSTEVPASTTPIPTTVPRPTLPKPTVPIPAAQPTELVITDLTEGTGPAAQVGDLVVVHYIGVRSTDGVEFDNSFEKGEPFQVPLGEGSVIAGWDQGLVGAKAGGTRRLDIPSDLAYGPEGQGDGSEIGPDQALSFIIDVLAVVPAIDPTQEPALVIAPSVPVPEIVPVDLVVGDGATAESGMTATFSYIFFRADTGEKLFSSWTDVPATIPLVNDGAIDGLIEGIVGMKVGGRRQVTIPARMVFGGAGSESLGLPPTTDLVMVVDLLAAY